MRKPLTGEPYAGNPPVRFGGRGGESLSYLYQTNGKNTNFIDRLYVEFYGLQRITGRIELVGAKGFEPSTMFVSG